MNLQFDVFLLETDGTAVWLDAVSTLDHAKECVQGFATPAGCRGYIVLDQRTGRKHVIQPEHSAPKKVVDVAGD
jgi:hypothetical protein